ncbi:MAG: M20/M25/M40 family metallo-hydrolase [Planctomycetes bacterium]|nr:M20/M25/M40 family metallo-hydrolase [Planctomycetota bacterium]
MTSPQKAAAGAPDAAWLLDRTEALCRADTTTGREDHGLPALRTLLRELDARVELQEVAPGRHNVLALWGTPRLLFSTHLDTVPPFLPPRRQGDLLHGRGTCDAKGQIVAQFAAIQELLRRGHTGLAWLGVVGEETDSIGAVAAADLAPRLQTCVGAINGEPTENRLATGQRGALQLKLTTKGVAAHSGTPELGRSAIWPLIDWLQRLRALPVVADKDLGPEVWNLGAMQGGGALNVVPAHAEAMLFVRSLPDSRFVTKVRELAPADSAVEEMSFTPPERFTHLAGFEHATVTFGSDAPRIRRLVGGNRIALCGPGSIKVAHTLDERITGSELRAGCERLVAIADTFLAGSPS